MGYDLTSKAFPPLSETEEDELADQIAETGRYFRFSTVAFPKLILLAERHGWRPAQQLFPDADDYRSAPGCLEVSAEDASSLADTLELVLEALSGVRPMQLPQGEVELFPGSGILGFGPRDDITPEAFWSGDGAKEKIRRFIVFARQGGFTIS